MPNIKPTTRDKLREIELEDKFREFMVRHIDKFEEKEKCKIYYNYDLTIRVNEKGTNKKRK